MGYVSDCFRELGRFEILSIQLSNALMGISAGVEVPILTMLGRKLAYSEKTIANYVTLTAVCRVLADIPSGILAECVHMRCLMLWAICLQVLGCAVALVMKPGSFSITVFSAFDGISAGLFFLTRHIYATRLSKREHRGMVLSFFAGILRWSHVLGPLLLGAAATAWEKEQYYFSVPLVAAILAWLSIIVVGCYGGSKHEEHFHNRPKGKRGLTLDESKHLLPFAQAITAVNMDGSSHEDHVTMLSYESTAVTCDENDYGNACGHPTPKRSPRALDCGHNESMENCEFQLSAFGSIMAEHWSLIWRLGGYIILYVSIRANRKLLLTFAAARMDFTNSQLAFLLSFSFSFDALLFPLGGFLMDIYGSRWSMLPAVLGIGIAFMLLPLSPTPSWLYVMAAIFGTVDALGCGLVMTLVADHAPKKHGALFFGVMRTVQDMGHVLGSMVVSLIITRVEFVVCCYIWGVVSVVAAMWAWFIAPVVIH
ncbi:putative integral membrane transport protein [Trypanosoma cruzi]|uniref:Integral membrane transport protein, putative n=2 Tax=Trypanosoma cruzi TaxID=5693 RepID=Q4DRN1_TRYCC|nr:integral membrane transport protein, putative [Trypanosoma cruzi]EAN95191.1 integral membrane transport protein, putative [Trypanosoma cruzi]PWV09847.1 putative integral membrane transport protein [Trypanosoma cruzi]RNC37620.1 putative integral membrane transport protein, putative,drug resistance protein [Trypanosoma cruzi]|eukprot:XP_817042.1 integral membrane transport protein [Trypanosoma cruzi strain CL Brener]